MVSVFKSESLKRTLLRSYDEALLRWKTRVEEADVPTRFGTTHCLISGSADLPALVLLHGVGDNSAVMWVFNVPELCKSFRCIAVDTLGGPGKSVPNEAYDTDFSQVEWLEEVLDRLHLPAPHLLGVSNGAYMALNFACERPARFSRAVCIEGGPVTQPLLSVLRTLKLLFPEILLPSDRNLVHIMKKLASPDADVWERHPWIADHMILAMRGHNRQAMFRHKLQKYDPQKAIAVRNRLFFILGGFRINEKKAFLDLLDRDGFRHATVEHAGHGVNHERPEDTNGLVRDFLLSS